MNAKSKPLSLFKIGLTGGIGSGKSVASKAFTELGITVIDTDVISRELTAPGGKAIEHIRSAFGYDSLSEDGSMNRAWMRERVFNNEYELDKLEGIMHPLIRKESNRRVAAASGPYVVLEVPLLIGSGNWKRWINRVLVIDCPVKVQIERVMARNGLTEEQVEAIINAQVSRKERLNAADDVIENVGPIEEVAAQVRQLHEKYLELAAQRARATVTD